SAIAGGERSAWVDAAGTIGPDWVDGPLLVRPADPMRRVNALRSTEVLLRSGGFALVVLAGAEPKGAEMVRLVRAAREGGGAFVTLTQNPTLATIHLTSRILANSYRWQRGPFDDSASPIDATVDVRARAR